ncbi:ferrochelatase [Aliikangiella marina]|uniref:Ferrochelatase n=1 Tax=Aliikangiella marina TaxID=1712262 RepID=A0A545T7H5_9GAMM|nr:ferrochelatase [Aliikangiella marina]TQV73148.1 ferrochelatase [Aliikangiella marina]
MKYQGNPDYSHKQTDKIGVLLTNLGTPEAPTARALKPYLKEFLSDPRVVEIPRLVWWFILNGIILNIRPKRSAEAYQSVWTEDGSPLLVHTRDQTTKIRQSLTESYGDKIIVEFAMRYGNPSIKSVLGKMMAEGVNKLVVLPLYPQYSGSTTGSTFDAIAADFTQRRYLPELRFINHYHDNPGYIDAIANKIKLFREQHGKADKLIFSYHGVPKRYLLNGDPYHCECHKTTRLVAEKLGLYKDEYMTCFQSRFGREEWLKPYTDHTLKALPSQGVKTVQVVCPGFSSDCLETIEEIGMENKEYFIESGGEDYQYIPALNSDDGHIDALLSLLHSNLHGWTVEENSRIRFEQASHFGAKQ